MTLHTHLAQGSFYQPLFEVPSNILLYRIGARVWLSRIMVTWGWLCRHDVLLMMKPPLLCCVSYLVSVKLASFRGYSVFNLLVPQNIRARVTGYFLFGAPLAFIIGGPLSGSIIVVRRNFICLGFIRLAVNVCRRRFISVYCRDLGVLYLDDRPEKPNG